MFNVFKVTHSQMSASETEFISPRMTQNYFSHIMSVWVLVVGESCWHGCII